jgi:hypothetical protein
MISDIVLPSHTQSSLKTTTAAATTTSFVFFFGLDYKESGSEFTIISSQAKTTSIKVNNRSYDKQQ